MDHLRRRICLTTNWPDYRLQAGLVAWGTQHRWQLLNLDHIGSQIFALGEVDGLIVNLTAHTEIRNPKAAELRQRAERWGCPVVNLSLHRLAWDIPRQGCVVHDDYEIGRLAAEHVLHLGFRDLAFHRHNRHNNYTHGRERHRGFDEAAAAAGATLHESWGSPVHDQAAVVERLRAMPKPLAIQLENDYLASAMCDVLHAFHVQVPQEVAICGVENDPLIGPHNLPPLSSVDVNREEQGYRAAQLLDALIDGAEESEPVLIQPRGVVARRTTDRVAVTNPHVAAALELIRSAYRDELVPDDVVAASGVSRATLYREFQRHMGHSIAAEIAHHRIQHACTRLADSGDELEAIAVASGFSNAQHMRRAFVRDKGLTPSAYRERARSNEAEIERVFEYDALSPEELDLLKGRR